MLSQLVASLCGSVDRNKPTLSRILCQALLLTTLYGLGHAAASADPEQVSRIAVVFVKPERFTDVKRSDFKPNSDAILDAIAKFMEEMGDDATTGY